MQSFSLYIHYPFCKKLCNYCDFYKKTISAGQSYEELEKGLQTHFNSVLSLIEEKGAPSLGSIDTLYLGGGTPSLWGEEGAEFLGKFLKTNGLEFSNGHEFTIEVDPGAWTESGLRSWHKLGVNRYSIGLQSLNSDFIEIMDRSHDVGESLKTLKYFKDAGCNYSVDLMLGLPYSVERKRKIREEIDMAMDYRPSHFSVYILKTRKNYPHNDVLPDDTFTSEEYLEVSEILKSYGFDHYEVSNFALPGKYSEHNQKYWRAQTVHALGPNATGFFMFSSNQAVRYQHRPSNTGYSKEELNESELKLEQVYLGLRTNSGLDTRTHFRSSQVTEIVKKWSGLGYVHKFESGQLVLSSKGYLMIDSLMDDLFRFELL